MIGIQQSVDEALAGSGRKWLFWGLLCFASILLVPAGASGSATTGERVDGPTAVTVAMLPIDPAGQPFYAKHRGFFLKQGST